MKLSLTATAASLLTLAAVVASPAVAAAPTIELKPGSIDRGAGIAGPHVVGRTLVDGSTRIKFRWPTVVLLGTSGPAYMVTMSKSDGSAARTLRVRPDGTHRVVASGRSAWDSLLSRDGQHLIAERSTTAKRTVIQAIDAHNGEVVAERTFAGSATVLDADKGRAILGSWGPNRTFWWNFLADQTNPINHRTGYRADIRADRFASFTDDPYNGGCSVVSDLSRAVLSRSCRERVETFAPDGRRIATVDILSDGIGPSAVTVRRTNGGTALADYTAEWFGTLSWETNTALLLDTNGRSKAATVRCDVASCERATDLKPVPQY